MQQGDRRDDTAGGDRRERGFTRGGSKGGFYGSRGRARGYEKLLIPSSIYCFELPCFFLIVP
jgi:hypothetical protein